MLGPLWTIQQCLYYISQSRLRKHWCLKANFHHSNLDLQSFFTRIRDSVLSLRSLFNLKTPRLLTTFISSPLGSIVLVLYTFLLFISCTANLSSPNDILIFWKHEWIQLELLVAYIMRSFINNRCFEGCSWSFASL